MLKNEYGIYNRKTRSKYNIRLDNKYSKTRFNCEKNTFQNLPSADTLVAKKEYQSNNMPKLVDMSFRAVTCIL